MKNSTNSSDFHNYNLLNGKHLPVVCGKNILLIRFPSITHIEADGSYSKIFCDQNDIFQTCKNIGYYENLLPSPIFLGYTTSLSST